MLSGSLGKASLGQFALAASGTGNTPPPPSVNPAPSDRTFLVARDAYPWVGYKTPTEVINFTFDWSREIGDDIITASSWTISSTEVVDSADSVDVTGTLATILLSAGVVPNTYYVTNEIQTESGLTLDATFALYIKQYNNL